MGLAYRQLSLDERRLVFRMVDARRPLAEIARTLGRHRSTIHREIRRNSVPIERVRRRYRYQEHAAFDGYFPVTAHDLVRRRRSRLEKMQALQALRLAVIAQLRLGWSPQQIAGRLKLAAGEERVSHETIYQYVYSPEGRQAQLHACDAGPPPAPTAFRA